MPKVKQPVTDDTIKVRQLSHYQQALLRRASDVHYDVARRTLMFGTAPVGAA